MVGQDLDATGWDDTNTDFINPGSNAFTVRWLEDEVPAWGTLVFVGQTYQLSFGVREGALGVVIDSQQILVDPTKTINQATARITVCRDAARTSCAQRVYRTIAGG